MEIDEEYIDKVKSLIEQKDAENVKTLLTDLHPADIAELCNDLGLEEARFVYRLLEVVVRELTVAQRVEHRKRKSIRTETDG